MGVDLGKNYYFVDTLFEDIDQLDNFVDHRIWKLELEDKEEEMQKFSEMSVGDYIVAKTSYTRKKELPFENPNNNTVSVMRIMAVGLIEKILNDEHSLSVNWIKNYQQENKEWYFYTSKELIWQPDVHKSEFAKKLIEFSIEDIEQDYYYFLNDPYWKGQWYGKLDVTLKKGEPLTLRYEDLEKRKLLSFKVNGKEFTRENLKHFAWKRIVEQVALLLEIPYKEDTEITLGDVFPEATDAKIKDLTSNFRNAIGFYSSKEKVEEQKTIRIASKMTNILEIQLGGKSVWYATFAGIDALMLVQGLLNKFGTGTEEILIEYSSNKKNVAVKERKDKDVNGIETEATEKIESMGLNTILYGPPGTGKTYQINEYREKLIGNQLTKEQEFNFDGYSWKDIIYLAYKEYDYKSLTIKEIEKSKIVQEYAKTKKNKSIYGTLSTEVNENATNESTKSTYRRGTDFFEKIDNQWSLTRVGRMDAGEVPTPVQKQTEANFFFEFVTFHQSFGYEDFIEGIRAESIDGNIHYEVKDGVFLRFCRKAKKDLENGNTNKFLFVIDEINRGNISKIFGELITLIEDSKRMRYEDGNWDGMTATLPYSGESFGVPNNVYILGTMNTADRSISMMDTALRRRFEFVEKMPDSDVIRENVGDNGIIDTVDVAEILDILNKRIRVLYDREHTLGHAFFINNQSMEDLQKTFENKILPLLQEYFYDDFRKIKAILNDSHEIYIRTEKESLADVFDTNILDEWMEEDSGHFELITSVSLKEFEKFIANIANQSSGAVNE
ncbi:MAG: AAA family ATPase [Carnobacterium sp.]|uniref:McrB family protein n=1 Tax=Carnobacterium TaxID=2747 RepID=UPI00203EC16F|nr:AAA family ATPase [Carnobacterium inhibens]MCM3513318.1 AAA family ATPase [Carnobacterium inhibens]